MSVSGDHVLATLGGRIPEGSRLVPVVRRVDDPRRLAGYALRAVLREQGVEAGDTIELGGRSEKMSLVLHTSRPLDEIVMRLGKESDNFAAEMLLRATGEGKGGTTSAADGAATVTKFLQGFGAFDAGMKITNGSGLFDANRSTASGVTKLLVHAYGDPAIAPEFLAQLSIAGVDGTLKHRMKKWADRRVIRAKTGTLASSIALSGYVLAPEGEASVAFSILANDVTGKGAEVRAAMDASVDAVAAELWHGR
jgi:D-alanyl-D-alanine carboxypeptidase/D-alanyl-D-alanine-endopeptidase (penicillin-binding protein 4)